MGGLNMRIKLSLGTASKPQYQKLLSQKGTMDMRIIGVHDLVEAA
jgi:hypothetical protein